MGVQARKDVLDVVDGEHDATYAQRVRRSVLRLSADRRRPVDASSSTTVPTLSIRRIVIDSSTGQETGSAMTTSCPGDS
jgi:hypothetical protein